MTFSKPELHRDEQYDQAVRFAIDRRHAAVMPVLSANPGNGVRTVDDGPLTDWQQVYESAATSLLSGVPGVNGPTLHGAYVRDAVRPAMRGAGRDRFR